MKLDISKRHCIYCDEIKPKGSFYKSLNPRHKSGVLPVCKSCVELLYNDYFEKVGRYDAAMWCVCADIGVPFVFDVWQDVLSDYESRSEQMKSHAPIAIYLSKLYDRMDIIEGFWQSDRMLNSFMDIGQNDSVQTDVDIEHKRESQRDEWGEFDDADLDYLDKQFKEYTSSLTGMDKITTMRYHDLCKAELSKRKADLAGDYGDINKARDNLLAIMKLLKLDNFHGNERTDEEKRVERIIWNIEHTKPAECEDLDKYRDFSNFGKQWKTIMRCIQNAITGTRDYPNVPKSEK